MVSANCQCVMSSSTHPTAEKRVFSPTKIKQGQDTGKSISSYIELCPTTTRLIHTLEGAPPRAISSLQPVHMNVVFTLIPPFTMRQYLITSQLI